ncbi:voltage-gated inwardly rectifying potassium channel KCNH3-like isoform X2 [Apostichopus japonicus]
MQKSCACKFLYGPDTAVDTIISIENALEEKEELKTESIFHKKDSTPFWCLLDIVPIKNEKSEVVLFLASHKDISKQKTTSDRDSEDAEDESNSDSDSLVDGPPANYNYNRRRSRAVLYHLSGHLKQQEKKKRKLKLNSRLLAPKPTNLPEYKVAAMKKSRFIVLHYSTFKSIWDWWVLLATLYIAVVVPYYAAVSPNPTLVVNGVNIMVEITFLTDIIINFRTTFCSKSGQVVYEPRSIALHYLQSWFLIDLPAAIPFDLFESISILNSDSPAIQLIKLIRLMRLLRIMSKIEHYSQYSAIVLTFFMLAFALLAHWLGCLWYYIGEQELNMNGNESYGWFTELSERTGQPFTMSPTDQVYVGGPSNESRYITSLYYTLSSLTSIGFGNVSANTNAEKIFTIIIMLIGALGHAAIFGNVTAIIQRMYSRRALYHMRLRDLKDFVRSHDLPPILKTRMQEYFMTSYSVNMGIDTTEMLHTFPEELRADITMHLNKEFLSLPIFVDASQGCLRSLSLRIKTSFCAPGEYIIHQGDSLNVVYFLLNGSMEILRQGMVVAILGKGDLFGVDLNDAEAIIQSTGDIHALTYCDLQSITRQELMEVLSCYPEYQQKFQTEIARDLTFNLGEGGELDADEESYAYCDLALNSRPVQLTSISEIQGEEDEDTSEDEQQKENGAKENCTFGLDDDKQHIILEATNSVGNSLPPDLSPRIVDGVEDDTSTCLRRNTFDFTTPNPKNTHQSVRNRSLSLNPSKPPSNYFGQSSVDGRLKSSYTAPQLSQETGSRSTIDSLCTEELRNEIEHTRNSVERLDRQVCHLSKDVSNLSNDLKSVIRLLQVILPVNQSTHGPTPSPNGPSGSSREAFLRPTSPRMLSVKIDHGDHHPTRFEDIVHVQRQDGVLETSLGGGPLPFSIPPVSLNPLPTVALKTSVTSNGDIKKLSAPPVKETNLVLFQESSDSEKEGDPLKVDYDSEDGTDL